MTPHPILVNGPAGRVAAHLCANTPPTPDDWDDLHAVYATQCDQLGYNGTSARETITSLFILAFTLTQHTPTVTHLSDFPHTHHRQAVTDTLKGRGHPKADPDTIRRVVTGWLTHNDRELTPDETHRAETVYAMIPHPTHLPIRRNVSPVHAPRHTVASR